MARPKVARLGKSVPEELVLLRRFGALPLRRDQLHLVAAGMLMLSGASADTAYQLHFHDRRRNAKARARKGLFAEELDDIKAEWFKSGLTAPKPPKPKPRRTLVT